MYVGTYFDRLTKGKVEEVHYIIIIMDGRLYFGKYVAELNAMCFSSYIISQVLGTIHEVKAK